MQQTDLSHFMGDVQNVHDLRLMYGTYTSNGRRTECSCFTVDVQDMPVPQKAVRTLELTKHSQQLTECDWN